MASLRLHHIFRWLVTASFAGLLLANLSAHAWDMAGTKIIRLHGRDGQVHPVGTVRFEPMGDKMTFMVKMDPTRLKDFFLSMREFKCVEGTGEIQCHVPYPYPNPATVSGTDLVWLEHSLLFLFKQPKDFGAKWWNGLYYTLRLTDQGLIGTPEAIDLNQISAPHGNLNTPPYGPAARSAIAPESRWFNQLSIQ
jgi:hypothetical protein